MNEMTDSLIHVDTIEENDSNFSDSSLFEMAYLKKRT